MTITDELIIADRAKRAADLTGKILVLRTSYTRKPVHRVPQFRNGGTWVRVAGVLERVTRLEEEDLGVGRRPFSLFYVED